MEGVIVYKDTRRIVMNYVLIVNQIMVKLYFRVNIKMHKMVYGLMANSVMMAIMIPEMAAIIFK